jgi:nitrate reductase beta subunit
VFLDPEDADVQAQAERDGIPHDWIEHARRSPVWALAHRYRIALPLHPEYRTLPMVWYVPPLSPIINALETDGYEADPDDLFPAIESMRIPVDYLANLLAAGDSEVIRGVLRRLAAMRSHMRKREVLGCSDDASAKAVGMSVEDLEDMYRLLAIAKYEDRYVIPKAHGELGDSLMTHQGAAGLDFAAGSCAVAGYDSDAGEQAAADTDGFMLTARPRSPSGGDDELDSGGPVKLDIIEMLGERRQSEGLAP